MLFRMDYLLGGPLGIPRPELGSIARLNYELLTALPLNTREGSAFVNAEATLILNPADPYCWGIREA